MNGEHPARGEPHYRSAVAVLRVERPHDGRGIIRRLIVEIDGHRVALLKQGESVDLTVPPGAHSVVGRMDWISSPTLDVHVDEGEQARVEVALPISALWNMVRRPRSALSIRRL